MACYTLTALEDVYLPYKPKRKTRAEAARKLGLEPLAGILMKQEHRDAEQLAQRFVRGEGAGCRVCVGGCPRHHGRMDQ